MGAMKDASGSGVGRGCLMWKPLRPGDFVQGVIKEVEQREARLLPKKGQKVGDIDCFEDGTPKSVFMLHMVGVTGRCDGEDAAGVPEIMRNGCRVLLRGMQVALALAGLRGREETGRGFRLEYLGRSRVGGTPDNRPKCYAVRWTDDAGAWGEPLAMSLDGEDADDGPQWGKPAADAPAETAEPAKPAARKGK